MKRIITILLFALILLSVNNSIAQTAYITNQSDNTVSVIDIANNTVLVTIAVGVSPTGVSVSSDGTRVYVTNQDAVGIVSVISTVTNTILYSIPVGAFPQGISVNPDGTKVYVANYGANTVSVINTATNTISATIPVGSTPTSISVSPDGSKVYCANYGANTLSVINSATNNVTATIAVSTYPDAMSISPDGSKLYVANNQSNTVCVINTSTNTISDTIQVGINPGGISISPDGSKVYVSNYGSNSLRVINTTNDSVITSIPCGIAPLGVSVNSDGSKIYVVDNAFAGLVKVINATTNTVVASIPVGSYPMAFGNFISIYNTNCFAHYTTTYDSTLNNFTLNVDSISSYLATSYNWDFGDGITSTLATPTHTFTQDTTYNVCMKIYTASGDSCEYCHIIGKDYLGNIYRTAGFTVNVQNAVGVPNLTNEQNITISPNPFSSQTTITFSSEQKNSTIKVVNVLGETIQQLTTNASTSSATGQQQLTLDMSNVAKGMYFVEINFDGTSASSITQQRSVVKVVKE